MLQHSLSQTLGRLAAADRRLVLGLAVAAVATLLVGLGLGIATALIRTGYADAAPQTGYRAMTGHGVAVFFYWLYFAQMALLLAFAAAERAAAPGLSLRPVAWTGLALMLGGFLAGQAGSWGGNPLLYDGSPDLVGDRWWPATLFYGGYVAQAAGLALLALAAIATTLAARRETPDGEWSTVGFAVTAWAGLVVVSSIATLYTFLPATLWTLGLAAAPANHATGWHLLFHNLHYLPLMGMVIVWYAVIADLAGTTSIFGRRFSKAIFTLYLVFVPPTSLYHMFLEPGLPALVRSLGSLLSLFISVPTIAVFLVVVTSLEAQARAAGAKGLFGWLRALPWDEPAISAFAWAAVNLALGGIFAFVLIQQRLAPLLSDTFFVPAYFHFLTVGTVSLSLMGAIAWLLPALTGRSLGLAPLLRRLPVAVTAGLALFGAAGMAAGLGGMPRRVIDASYEGTAPALWTAMSAPIAAGAAIMGVGLFAYAAILALGFATGAPRSAVRKPAVAVPVKGPYPASWTAALCVALLILGMYAATALAFALLRALPLASIV